MGGFSAHFSVQRVLTFPPSTLVEALENRIFCIASFLTCAGSFKFKRSTFHVVEVEQHVTLVGTRTRPQQIEPFTLPGARGDMP